MTRYLISIIVTLFLSTLLYAGSSYHSTKHITEEDSILNLLDSLIHYEMIDQIRAAHNDNATEFTRQYINQTYNYDIWETPEQTGGYYLGTLREFKAQFMVAKVDFRAYPGKWKILMQDKQTKKFIPPKEWAKKYVKN